MLSPIASRLLRSLHALRTPRVKQIGAWLLAFGLVFTLLGQVVAPVIAKSVLTDQLSQALGCRVSIDKISIQPWALSVQVNGLSVKDHAGGEQFGFEQLDLNFSAVSLVQFGWVVDALHLKAPRVSLARLADGRYDMSDLLERGLAPNQSAHTGWPRFSLNNIEVSDGQLQFDDRPKGVRHTVQAIHFSLPFISSLPYKADVWVQPAFSAVIDGAPLTLKGQSQPFARAHASTLDVQLQDFALARLQPYWPASWPLRLQSGRLAMHLKIGFSQGPDGAQSLSLSGTARGQGLALSDASGAPYLGLDQLDVALREAHPLQGLWVFERVALSNLMATQAAAGPRLHIAQLALGQTRLDLPAHRLDAATLQAAALRAFIVRTPEGRVDWLPLPQAASVTAPRADDRNSATPTAAAAPNTPWALRLGRLDLQESGLRFEDRTLKPAAVHALEHVRLSAQDLDNVPGHSHTFSLGASTLPTGSFTADGTLQWQPLALRLKIDSRDLPVAPLQGYLDPYLNAVALQGQLSSQGLLDLHEQQGELQARYQGALTVSAFGATDKASQTDVLKWKSLYAGALDLGWAPARVTVGEVALSDFYSRLILDKDGRLNLAEMVRRPPGPAPVAAAGSQAKPETNRPWPIQIAKVTLQNGQVHFTDSFVRPNYRANVSHLGGSIRNLSSAPDSVAELDLRGSYADHAPVHIAGQLNPLAERKFLNLKADIANINLVDLSPYSGKYAGYAIEKGQLSLNASYKLENRQLTADNRLFINQLTFGEKVESPDATHLPVHLAIALLKNNRGEIDINLPISGSLDDPQFSIGGLVAKVIANLFIKTVTAPFAFLGALLGEHQELSFIVFAPGRSALDEAALKKLEALAKAMREREGLRLEIRASADTELDTEGLKQQALAQAVRADSGAAPNASMHADDYASALARAYRQASFPKPRNLLGLPKTLSVPEMEKLMLTHQTVSADDLRQLAEARAQAVQSWLLEQGQIPLNRLFVLPTQLGTGTANAPGAQGARVDFSLR